MPHDAVYTADRADRITGTVADLTWIARSWPDLHQMRLPGTRRRRIRRPLSRIARQRADELARTERQEQRLAALGTSRAPMHVSVLDDLAQVLADTTEMAARINAAVRIVEPDPPSTVYDFAALDRLLAYAAAHLAAAADAEPGILDDAQAAAARMRRTLERSLSEIVDGQVLSTVCAWCHGRTTQAPAGGQRTLVVRLVAGDPLIVCESDACEPPEADCGTWLFGKPAWPDAEWGWLAKRLGA
ncbi:cytochrome c553 [Lipingzhangella halophila]|uniref:Cytochrome c553 n=1 Tax=Lipingzhangella halophila TaxID=1783352 RepID=A0A7W7W757_9ACTN|nr:hypothetical protein [Lipingzhangella halophila]MBB4935669.1 cytochrome c553 [Lipingzhangella halophila]